MTIRTITLPTLSLIGLTTLGALALPSSALAGDLDGDGLDDLIVGAHRLEKLGKSNVGGIGVLLGSSDEVLFADELFTPLSIEGGRAGFAVATGDFNCDGNEDVALGAPSIDNVELNDGAVYVLYGNGDGSFSPNTTYITRQMFVDDEFIGEDDHFGRSLAAGDFDGDGCSDLAIGAPRAVVMGTNDNNGIVYVAYGSAQLLTVGYGSRNKIEFEPENGDARFGFSLAVGNFDGDSKDELVISAPTFRDPDQDDDTVGLVQVREYIGGGQGFDPIANLVGGSDEVDGWHGWSLATGDFDGDGSLDIAAGAPGYQNDFVGHVVVYDAGLTHAAALSVSSDLNTRFGYALAAGDIDADGYDDLAIGAPMYTDPNGPQGSGAVWMFEGGANGAQVNGSPLLPMDLAGNNSGTGQKFGSDVALGHYSGGGLDLAVGAKRAKADNSVRTGAVFTYLNDNGNLSVETKISLEDFGWGSSAGALFGAALSR